MRRVLGLGYSVLWKPPLSPSVPTPRISLRSSASSSITTGATYAEGQVVTAWGGAATATGTPFLITDNITGRKAIRFGASSKLTFAAGAGDFLSKGGHTVIVVCRTRHKGYTTVAAPIDSTAGGSTPGYQLQFSTFTNQTVFPRIFDGATWLLDTDNAEGMFVEQKWTLITERTSATNSDIRCDGQFLHIGGRTISLSFPQGTPSPLDIGGYPIDFLAVDLYDKVLTDNEVANAEATLEAEFGIDLLKVISGDPTLLTTNSATFPYMSKLPGGKLYLTIYKGHDGPTATDSNVYMLSADGGKTWSAETLITQNSPAGPWYGDMHTSEPLSDGQVLQHWQLFDNLGNVQTKLQWRKSTGFNADGSPIWGTTHDLPVAGVDWIATGAAAVELAPGEYHIPAYALQTGHTHESLYDLKSTDSGSTWTTTLVRDGDTDARRYVEHSYVITGTAGELFLFTRVAGGSTAFQGHTTDSGTSWSAPIDSTAQLISSAQATRKLASGAYASFGRATFANTQTGAFYRPASDPVLGTNWKNPPANAPVIDPFFGGNYYTGFYEVSPGNLTVVFSRATGDVAKNNLGIRTNFYEWYMTFMPGDATPHTATVAASATQQLTVTGAGDPTYNITSNPGGCSINSTTGLFTAGTTAGTCTFTVTDCNGQQLAACSYTITGGGGGGLAPDQIDTGNLTVWWDPRRGITPDGSGHIATWTSSDTAARVLQALAVFDTGTGLNGHASIEFNGVDSAFAATITHLSDLIAANTSWTVFWVSKDTGSSVFSPGHYYNAPALCDGGAGQFGCGTTPTTAFAGQGGTYTELDEISQTGGVLHYYVAQYDAATGKIYMSKDGGAFDTGTSVTAISDFTGGIRVGQNPLVGSYFKGSLGDIAVWKSKLSSGNVTSLSAWASARYA